MRGTPGATSRARPPSDQFGHDRWVCVTYEPTGIFPFAAANTLGHTVYTAYDPGLGVMTAARDPNGLLDPVGARRLRPHHRADPAGRDVDHRLARAHQGRRPAGHVVGPRRDDDRGRGTEDLHPARRCRAPGAYDGGGRGREELRDVAVHVHADAREGHRVRPLRPRDPGGAALDGGRRAARAVCGHLRATTRPGA